MLELIELNQSLGREYEMVRSALLFRCLGLEIIAMVKNVNFKRKKQNIETAELQSMQFVCTNYFLFIFRIS